MPSLLTDHLVELAAETDIGICERGSENGRITGSYRRLAEYENSGNSNPLTDWTNDEPISMFNGFQQTNGARIIWQNNNWILYDRLNAPTVWDLHQ